MLGIGRETYELLLDVTGLVAGYTGNLHHIPFQLLVVLAGELKTLAIDSLPLCHIGVVALAGRFVDVALSDRLALHDLQVVDAVFL